MDPSTPVIFDVAGLQWWHWLLGTLGVLGFSAAPWIGGLAAGKIQFTAQANKTWDARIADLIKNHDARVVDLKQHHAEDLAERAERYAEMKESRDGYKVATSLERERADKATEALAQMVEVISASNHVVASFSEAAQTQHPLGGAQ